MEIIVKEALYFVSDFGFTTLCDQVQLKVFENKKTQTFQIGQKGIGKAVCDLMGKLTVLFQDATRSDVVGRELLTG
jgi:hypothetical protein